jgi:hypothetical protein
MEVDSLRHVLGELGLRCLLPGQTALGTAKEVWQIKASREHKFFLWLAIQDRCWTSEL